MVVRSVVLATGVLFGGATAGGITPALVAQTSPTSAAPFNWSSLVGGAIGSSPAALILAWRLTKADKERQELREELRGLHVSTAAEQRDLLNRVIPLIERAAGTLRDVEVGLGATVARSHPEDVDRAVRDLRGVVNDLRVLGGRDT